MKKLLISCLLFAFQQHAISQSVGIGTTTPHTSALLDITSENKGFLLPRMTTAQRNAIISPAAGLMVFDLTTQSSWLFDGVIWKPAVSNWVNEGVNIYNRNNGNVGIGSVSTPLERLHIFGNAMLSATSPALKFKSNLEEIGFVQGLSTGDIRLGVSTSNGTGRIALFTQAENRIYVHGNTLNTTTMEFHQDNTRIGSLTANSSGDISITTTATGGLIRLNSQLYVNGTENRVGIGTTLPAETFHVAGNTLIASGGVLSLAKVGGVRTVEIKSTESGTDGASMLLYNSSGVATIEIDADYGDGDGRILTSELQIRGGSDLAENFNVDDQDEIELKPGMLVSISEEKEGELCITKEANDKKIVGVISGANGIRPGMLMGQEGSIAFGKYPVALAGRVYVLTCDEGGQIKAGDFLTSSSKKGYAKKAESVATAQGAIIGKAMGSSDPATGYVLTLINLQ